MNLEKAIKHCIYNATSKQASWSRTNFSMCLLPSENVIEDMNEVKILEVN